MIIKKLIYQAYAFSLIALRVYHSPTNLMVVHMLVVVDVFSRLLVALLMPVVVSLLVLVRVVMLMLMHSNPSNLSLPLLEEQAGRGERGKGNKKEKERQEVSSHSSLS